MPAAFAFLSFLIAVAFVLFLAAVVSWNVNDIVTHGANFWNIFWLAIVGLVTFAGTSAATK